MDETEIPDVQAFESLTERFMKVQLHIIELRLALQAIRNLRPNDSEIVDLIDKALGVRPD